MKNIFHIIIHTFPVAIIILASLSSCTQSTSTSISNEDKEKLSVLLDDWIGKEITLDYTIGRFVVDGHRVDPKPLRSDFRILKYVGADGCTPCRMQLDRVQNLISGLSDSIGEPIDFICLINSSDRDQIRRAEFNKSAGLAIWIDEADSINAVNLFPDNELLNTFLLDNHNRVLAIGDPLVNPAIRNVYLGAMTNKKSFEANRQNTIAEVTPSELVFGNVHLGDTVTARATVVNSGNQPLYIDDITTSCYCTEAHIDSQVIAPGDSAHISIMFADNESKGAFVRYVWIWGNLDEELTIEISGTLTD